MKKITVILLLLAGLLQSTYAQTTDHEYTQEEIDNILSNYGSNLDNFNTYNEDYLKIFVVHGDETQSKLAQRILDLRKKEKELRDKIDSLSTKNNKFLSLLLGEKVYNKRVQKELDEYEDQLDAISCDRRDALTTLIDYSKNIKAVSKAQEKGDPVKITAGSYEQKETDFSQGNNLPIQITRVYNSSNTVCSSFGYGWSTNLDERLLFGIEPQIKESVMQDLVCLGQISSAIEVLKQNILEQYEITDIEEGYNQIETTVDAVKNDFLQVVKEAKLYNFDALEARANQGAETAEGLKSSLLEAYQNSKEILEQFEVLYAKIQEESVQDTEKLLQTQEHQAQNIMAFFPGMDPKLIETGANTIIVIDSAGYPEILYQTDSGTWETQGNKEKLRCTKSNGQYTITFFDGTIKQYDSNGFIKKIIDRNNNYIKINRGADEKITTIESSSGEKLSLSYEGRLIKSVTNMRDSAQKTQYSYNNNQLTSFTDTDGITVGMTYDSNGHMTCITKSDGSTVSFVYGQTDSLGNVFTTQTTNEEGYSEYFIYYPSERKTVYKDHDGNESITEYDNHHRTTREINPDGSITSYEYDDNNNLVQTNTNGEITKYKYDDFGNKTNVLYSDGSCEDFCYDSFGELTWHRDRDNIVYEYIRDNSGNLLEYKKGGKTVYTQAFDSRGNLTKQTVFGGKPIITEYEYDDFGNCILKKEAYSRTKYEYDSQNRITKIIRDNKTLSTYKYEKNKISRTNYNGLETTYFINNRRDITQMIKKDTVTGIVHNIEIEYDKRHLPLRVYAGDENTKKLVTSYLYTKEGKLMAQASHQEQMVVTFYTFLNDIIKTVNLFTTQDAPLLHSTLQQMITSAGENIFTYTISQTDENGNITVPQEEESLESFTYNPDDSIKTKTDCYGITSYYSYDDAGRLICIQNESGSVLYEYDSFDRITKQSVKSGGQAQTLYFITYEYSQNGRTVTITQGGKYKTTYDLDAFGNIIKETDGNQNTKQYEYDFLNQLVTAYDGYMNKTVYEYNGIGLVKCITLADGSTTEYEYNALGQTVKIKDDCGTVYQAQYDKTGKLIKEKSRSQAEQSYEYDKDGRMTKAFTGAQLVQAYSYNQDDRSLKVIDGKGFEYLYNYDLFGRLINEKNRLGDTQNYFYDQGGNLSSQKNFDGSTTSISYSHDHTRKTVHYSDQSEDIFIYDTAGFLIEIKNKYNHTQYEYDKGGMLILQRDLTTGEEISFEYDSAGNRTRLCSSNRDTFYTYGKNNELKEFFDNKQRVSVQLQYNKIGREILRKFGNGTTETTLYDRAGRITAKSHKSERGEILWAEGYLYNDDGKRSATVTNMAQVTLYEYNDKGQLSAVYYPCTDNNGINRFLSSKEKAELSVRLNEINYTLATSLTTMQVFKKEIYTYDKNGNLISKQTPLQTIEYTYDNENHLVSSSSHGQTLASYTYDKSGNLLREESPQKSTRYEYSPQNRLVYCQVIDKDDATCTQTRYYYDALGRRIIVQDFEEPALRTLYDGLTFNVIKQSPSFVNGTFSDSYETGIRWGTTGQPTGDRYRYLEDNKTSTDRYQKDRTQFSINNTIAAQVSSGGQTDYFSTDILGSVRTVTDMYGTQKKSFSYDAYGSLTQGEFSDTADFGYLGKQFDPTSNAYNYGYRDYNPQTARFTTKDPIRDGSNWFMYCNGDPVNFVDLWGDRVRDQGNLVQQSSDSRLANSGTTIYKSGCVLTAYVRIAQALTDKEITLDDANDLAYKNGLFTNGNELSVENGVKLINELIKDTGKKVAYAGSLTGSTTEIAKQINQIEASERDYFLTARIETTNDTGTETYEHTVSINSNSVFANDITDMENSMNIRVNDTSNADRKAIENDIRENKLLRVDLFILKEK